MAHKLLDKYIEGLKGNSVYTIHAPLAPLFLSFSWQKGKNYLDLLCINKGRNSVMSVNEPLYRAIAQDRFAQYMRGEITILDLKKEYDGLAADIDEIYHRIMRISLSKKSPTELQGYMREILKLFEGLADKTVYIETIDYDMVLEVIGTDKKSSLDTIWEHATHPSFLSFDMRRLGLLIDMIEKKSPAIIREAKFIFTDYFWTKKESEIQTALDDIADNIEEKKKEYHAAQKSVIARTKEFEKWKAGLTEYDARIAEYVQLMMLFRDIRKDIIAKLQTLQAEISVELLRHADIDPKHAQIVLTQEYVKGIDHLKSVKDNIEKRSGGYISICYSDSTYEIELCDFDMAVAEYHDRISQKDAHVAGAAHIVKGQIANKGKARGVVRIVLDPHNDKGFRAGDILVTSMTRPEFVPIMKKAAAVVTNEGGVTCHAAIVSRELGIPCIIGTKNATRALKDGDMVEVDANTGIVTKL
ncbi:MAG: hypothetical protein RIT04_496 [Candidatus Parcubacteria bacterium]|jgi:phosphohistidine swiveling domain-containing protein